MLYQWRGLHAIREFIGTYIIDAALAQRAIDLVTPYYRVTDMGRPLYASDEAYVRKTHDLSACLRTIGVASNAFTFASASAFSLPGWPDAAAAERLSDAFVLGILCSRASFVGRCDGFVESRVRPLERDVYDRLIEAANDHVPEGTRLLDKSVVRGDMVIALVLASVRHKPRLVDKLEPLARLLADAVPVFEIDGKGSGHWLMVID